MRRRMLICAIACAAVAGLAGTSAATAAEPGHQRAQPDRPQAVRLSGVDADGYASRAAGLDAYWTLRRRQQALANSSTGDSADATATATPPALDAPFAKTLSTTPSSGVDPNILATRLQTGKLFFTTATGEDAVCTAFSIPAGQGQAGMVQTARHCVQSDEDVQFTNLMFVPAYGWGGAPEGPYGSFPGLRVTTSGESGDDYGLGDDYAFLEVGQNARGQELWDTAGSMAWGTAELHDTDARTLSGTVVGYDDDVDEHVLRFCTDESIGVTALAVGTYWTSRACQLTDGMSGGPLIQCQGECDTNPQYTAIGNISADDEAFASMGPIVDWMVASDYNAATHRLTDEGIDPDNPPPGSDSGSGSGSSSGSDDGHDELIVDGAPPAPLPGGDSGGQDQGPSAAAPQPVERTAYYTSWSGYANNFLPKDLDMRGIAGKLTTLDYAFENIDPQNLTCMEANHPGSSDESDPAGNDGAADAWADYQRSFTADESVDGVADQWDQPLKGNFNQLKKLKAKYHLKVLVSLGGWTYSKYFSDVAATQASREKFVSSCIDMYIKGNLPQIDGDPAGGQGAAAGIFDGFDVDWEFPGSSNGHTGNHVSPEDAANFTALLAEFRRQLNALGGHDYQLTAAVPSGPSDIDKLQVASLAQSLDQADVMAYDMHGSFEATGPTNFQAPLFDSPASPAFGSGLTVDAAVSHYLDNGFPANKLTLGVPLYGRGWSGVPDGGTQGLYQSVTGPTDPFPLTQEPGVADYKELEAAGKLGDVHFDPVTKSSWAYDGTNWWSIESPDSIRAKRQYIADRHLAGVMLYSLEADDAQSTLLDAAVDPD